MPNAHAAPTGTRATVDAVPCAFCHSTGPLTKEHLWPLWVARVLDISEEATHTQRFRMAGGQGGAREFVRRPFRDKVGAVCGPCNNGWMSQLEAQTKHYAEGMLRGRSRQLHRTGQATLAMWATVKVLVAEYTIPQDMRLIPASHYTLVYEARHNFELPGATEVHTAAYADRRRPGFYDRTGMTLHMTDNVTGEHRESDAYVATFAAGPLALRVFGHTVPEPVHIGFRGPLAKSVMRIWPSEGSFTWPPGRPLDDAGLGWFSTPPAAAS